MITQEQAHQFLNSKKVALVTKKQLAKFSKKYKTLGLMVTSLDEKYLNNYYQTCEAAPDFKKEFGKNPLFNPWTTAEGKKLSLLLFGKVQSPFIPKVWDIINRLPYQRNWSRRSFRAKPDDAYLENKIFYLQHIYNAGREGMVGMTLLELAQYDSYNYNLGNCYFFAAALEDKKTKAVLYEKIKDILFGEDEVGGVSRNLIKGMLISEDPKNWEVVEKLLLAAQRQEGLRQVVLEPLDETSLGALEHFIKVILRENLIRFSSVVRAIDTWFGFGWEAPKTSTLKRVLNFALSFFENEALVKDALKSKDNLEVYVALWFLGLKDVDAANLEAATLLETGLKEKKILALMFMSATDRSNSRITKWLESELGKDLETDYWALQVRPKTMKINQHIFEGLKKYGDELPRDGKRFAGKVFAWTYYDIQADFFYKIMINHADRKQLETLAQDVSQVSTEQRPNLVRKIFSGYFKDDFAYLTIPDSPQLDFKKEPWRRSALHQVVQDRSMGTVDLGLSLLKHVDLEKADFDFIESMLARKNKELRENLIKLILKQPDKNISATVSNLLTSGKIDQRLAGLEILTILKDENRLSSFVETEVAAYKERKKFSKNESVFLEKFVEGSTQFSFENGFGIINYSELRPLMIPVEKFKHQTKKKAATKTKKAVKGKSVDELPSNFLFPKLFNLKKITKSVNELIDLIQENKDFEYEVLLKNDNKNTVLLGDNIHLTHHEAHKKSPLEKLDYLPLAQLWKAWYKSAQLNDFEMLAAIHNCSNFTRALTDIESLKEFHQQYVPVLLNLKLDEKGYYNSINRRVEDILEFLFNAYADVPTMLAFQQDVMEDMIVKIPKKYEANKKKAHWERDPPLWFDMIYQLTMGGGAFHDFWNHPALTKELLLRSWDIKMYLLSCETLHPELPKQFSLEEIAIKNLQNKKADCPNVALTIKLIQSEAISADDIQYQYLMSPGMMKTMEGTTNYYSKKIEFHPDLPQSFQPLKTNLIALEMERGDIPTDASKYLGNLKSIKGIHYLVNLLERLGKENLSRGYSWAVNESKKMSFSSLIKKCWPLEEETYKEFAAQAKGAKITKKRWIEVALYAPQWASWIGDLVKVKKLEDAVWWFHAHGSDYMTAEKETYISRYSNIEKMEFQDGAIDIEWFNEVYQSTGKQNWKLLHDAAKYISQSNGHRLVKLYSSIMLGEVKIREALAKIKDKRDKDYVRGLGLIPLSKANPAKDLLSRYNLLQAFLKESKQFGAQRQQSEKGAVSIGMDNLARNAGYEDSIRFNWVMEGKATQKVMEKSRVEIENVVLELIVDEQGSAHITIEKDGKPQKSIPAKLKKNKAVVELQKSKTYLRSQYKRTKVSLENAMLREDEFTAEELNNIMEHPVVQAMLSKLILFNTTKTIVGFWKENQLMQLDGKTKKSTSADRFVIAHPSHLYQSTTWDICQKYAFEHQIVQPFKQIFRELYLVTQNEKEKGTESNRYAGHQIQPMKAAALLRTRGWTVQYEEGLQKVHHKKNIIATMYAMADWFSPADVEAPTLEQVRFYDRKEGQTIYLADMDPIVFSEVMRDVDLVVSVAHVGGVDPEASHSTLEMRAVLAKESARLLKLKNVIVKERHIIIKGKLADYSIHLGSGIVSKGGLQLSIIPVHSQHRGRMFLPFVDDDPKSAEIISKMKLLAEDFGILDPTILAQING